MMKVNLTACSDLACERWFAISLFFISLTLLVSSDGLAKPFTPDSPDEVLVELPKPIVGLNRVQKQTQSDLEIALERARRLMLAAGSSNGSRWLGVIEKELQPWWDSSDRHVDVAMIKADIFQKQHAFRKSLKELNVVLKKHPQHAQAIMNRAWVNIMLTDYHSAAQDCSRLALVLDPAIGINCFARIQGLTGQGLFALQQLESTLSSIDSDEKTLRFELHLTAADIAHRHKLPETADSHFKRAFEIKPGDEYLLDVYSDFLIETRQTEQFFTLTTAAADSLSLRIKATALKRQTASRNLNASIKQFEQEFKLLNSESDLFPWKEHALYSLTVVKDYETALQSSLKNWQMQKDPSSALLVLRSANAAGQPLASRDVIKHIRDTGLFDYRLEMLMQQLQQTGAMV